MIAEMITVIVKNKIEASNIERELVKLFPYQEVQKFLDMSVFDVLNAFKLRDLLYAIGEEE